MKLMDHLHWEDINDENLNFFKAIGVDCLLAHLPGELADGRDPTDEMRRVKKFVEDHGLELYAIHSHQVPRERIIHGQPGREMELVNWRPWVPPSLGWPRSPRRRSVASAPSSSRVLSDT